MTYFEKVREMKLKEIFQSLDSEYQEIVEEEFLMFVKDFDYSPTPAQLGE